MSYLKHPTIKLDQIQEDAIDAILTQKRVLLDIYMGTGKTAIYWLAAQELLRRNRRAKILMVSKKRVIDTGFLKCRDTFTPKLTSVHNAGVTKRLDPKASVNLLHESKLEMVLNQPISWDMILIDECQAYKNPQSKRTKMLTMLPKPKYYVLSSGTVMTEKLEEFYSPLHILGRFKESLNHFRNKYMSAEMDYAFRYDYKTGRQVKKECIVWKSNNQSLEKLKNFMRDFYIYKHDRPAKAPKPHFHDIFIEKDQELYKAEKEIRNRKQSMNELVAKFGGTTKKAGEFPAESQDLGRMLLQNTGGGFYNFPCVNQSEVMLTNRCKVKALGKLLAQLDNSPKLIAYVFNFERDVMMKRLKGAVDLGTCPKDFDYQTEWDNKRIPYLLIKPQSGGVGTNFQRGGYHMIWYSICFSYQSYLQACERLPRRGNGGKKVEIYHLVVKNSRDEERFKAVVKEKKNFRDTVNKALQWF